jgi:hypothetical protein
MSRWGEGQQFWEIAVGVFGPAERRSRPAVRSFVETAAPATPFVCFIYFSWGYVCAVDIFPPPDTPTATPFQCCQVGTHLSP